MDQNEQLCGKAVLMYGNLYSVCRYTLVSLLSMVYFDLVYNSVFLQKEWKRKQM